MEAEEMFVSISGLICEPVRARMLWNLLDGRAYTATELAIAADVSVTAASNHLAKLLDADIVKVEAQGRNRYYSFSRPEIAYVVESLASLAGDKTKKAVPADGVKFCRTCYDHLAGFVGVQVTEALETKGYLKRSGSAYAVTEKGWQWFAEFGITGDELMKSRRPLTRQCLDWSERRPHLAGQLGAVFLEKVLERKWFKKVQFSRELTVTSLGRTELSGLLGVVLP
jgi:DNA-binding transcriptional ArsR family regulator